MNVLRKIGRALLISGLLLLIPVILVLLPFALVGMWLRGKWLQLRFHKKWGRRGKSMLFVYSNSPNWQQYIEQNWLPDLAPHSVVLNWSERNRWRETARLESRVFRHFARTREFNPIAIYLPRFGSVRTIRFWKPFKDFKHGRDRLLKRAEAELFEVLARAKSA